MRAPVSRALHSEAEESYAIRAQLFVVTLFPLKWGRVSVSGSIPGGYR